LKNEEFSMENIEDKIENKFNKAHYPWISKETLQIKEIFLFLHNEILDFAKFI
jgi:ATP phosphoribosyltransferase regulatory subunit HisZ